MFVLGQWSSSKHYTIWERNVIKSSAKNHIIINIIKYQKQLTGQPIPGSTAMGSQRYGCQSTVWHGWNSKHSWSELPNQQCPKTVVNSTSGTCGGRMDIHLAQLQIVKPNTPNQIGQANLPTYPRNQPTTTAARQLHGSSRANRPLPHLQATKAYMCNEPTIQQILN